MTIRIAANNGLKSTAPIPCKICCGDSFLFDVVDFNKFCSQIDYYSHGLSGIPIYYRKCQTCGLIFTDNLDSLDKNGFSELIYNVDYVKYDPDYIEKRPKDNANFLSNFLSPIKPFVKGLDYGSGNGLTASTLAQRGWKYEACDPITNNVQPSQEFGNFNVISAIEVFEHIPFPLLGMEDLLRYAAKDCLLIVGTQVTDEQITEKRLDWWYAGPRNGHVTLHSRASLRLLFQKYGFSYYSPSSSLHLGVRGTPPDPGFSQPNNSLRAKTWGRIKRLLARQFLK